MGRLGGVSAGKGFGAYGKAGASLFINGKGGGDWILRRLLLFLDCWVSFLNHNLHESTRPT